MKIAQISCVYPPYKGGIATSAENIARVFKSSGQEVKSFTISPSCEGGGGRGLKQSESDVIRLKTFPGSGNGGVLPLMCWRLKDFDLIYLHYPFFGTAEVIWFLKKFIWRKKKKLVVQYHMDPVLPNIFLKILSLPAALVFNSLFKNADLIVAASLDYIKNSRIQNIYAQYPEKFVEIPFGVDTEKFKPLGEPQSSANDGGTDILKTVNLPILEEIYPSRGAQDDKKQDNFFDKFKLLFVGGLDQAHYFKGIDVLLNALSLLNKNNPNWGLEIVGEGDLRLSYENKARELGIADKVNFSGHVSDEDLPKKYQAADCFVLPSINKGEAFGIVLLEAMSSGLPAIASDLPGVRGVFTPESGLLIKLGDAEDLKEKIKFLIDNPTRRGEMGVAARREAEEKYSFKKIEERLKKIPIQLSR